jgi:multidrug efflux pump subunit AcrA (membrane-fusion protein)
MKPWKILLTISLIAAISLATFGCSSESGSDTDGEMQTATVTTGELSTYISAGGNLEFASSETMRFETAGTVVEILVENGDLVQAGDILAKLDTSALEDSLTTAEKAFKTKGLDLNAAERSVTTSGIDLETARNNYEQLIYPYTYTTFAFSIPASVDALNAALIEIANMISMLKNNTPDSGEELLPSDIDKLERMQTDLLEAKEKLVLGQGDGILATTPDGASTGSTYADYWTLRSKQLTWDKAELGLKTAEDNLEKAKMNLDSASDDLDDARKALEEAVITAPADGVVISINIEEGDEVKNGQTAMYVANPDKFEATILVSEMDIPSVKMGSAATVQLDSMAGITIPATVTYISPTATISAGVVNYEVRIELESPDDLNSGNSGASRPTGLTRDNAPTNQMDEAAFEEMLKQRLGEDQEIPRRADGSIDREALQGLMGGMGQRADNAAEDGGTTVTGILREGLSVTASILKETSGENTLLVPNRAIISEGGQTYVEVLIDGNTRKQAITVGLNDIYYTAVTDGLSEGDVVILQTGISTAPSSGQQGMRLPGMGGGSR